VAGDPENPLLRIQAVQLALHTGDGAGAARELAELRRLVPASPEVAALEAFVALRAGRAAEAVAVLRSAADAWPYHYQTYTLLAAVWAQTGVHEARAWFEDRVRRWPGSRVLRAACGEVLRRAGDAAAAGQAWREVLAESPDDERALAPLVDLLAEQDRLDEARVLMERAYAVNPRSYPNNARLAQLAEHRGDADAQARYLDALADSGPVDARVHAERARLHRAAGRTEAARRALLAGRRQARAEGDESLLRHFQAALGEVD
jgi:predicted Zn-dependent protease